MTRRLKYEDAKLAIYRLVGGSDAPFDDPLGELDRIDFHSSLDYPAIVDVRSGSVNLPSRSKNQQGWDTHNLFNHNRGGTPLVLGQLNNIDDDPVALAGSVPIQMNAAAWGRWVTLGANETKVRLAEQYCTENISSGGISSKSLNWTVYVFDVNL